MRRNPWKSENTTDSPVKFSEDSLGFPTITQKEENFALNSEAKKGRRPKKPTVTTQNLKQSTPENFVQDSKFKSQQEIKSDREIESPFKKMAMMQDVIPIINQLQFVFKSTGYGEIQLPQIVVVGSQSCGKSSVLESLVCKSFLPRGSGIVTRCPIVLQLTNTSHKNDDGEANEYCVFANDPDTKIEDFDKVREIIEQMTDESAGKNKGISMDPIIIQVYSPNVVSLTVVDLPGIVKNPVGDQPADIETQVENLIKHYIENENALILAVSPGNADIATSDSIKMAKAVDPDGDRTLGVITKLDLLDKGTNAIDVLDGKTIKVKLGIIGVVNRSQEDIDNNTSIESAMENEKRFLDNAYPSKYGEIGSTYLANKLNELLIKHIQSCLPGLIQRINEKTTEYVQKKKELGPPVAAGELELTWMILQAVTDFKEDFKSQVKGRQQTQTQTQSTQIKGKNKKLLGAQIAEIFNTFNSRLEMFCNQQNATKYSNEKMKLLEALANTVNVERFTSIEEVFKNLVREKIRGMEEYSLKCAEQVQDALQQAVVESLKDKRLKKLNDEIVRVVRKLLKKKLEETKDAIETYINVQTGMIFSTDERFTKLMKNEEADDEDEVLAGSVSFPMSSTITNGQNQCDYVEGLVRTYVDVMRNQICDYIPKHIMHYLYESTMKNLSTEIQHAVAGKESKLMEEPEAIVRRRRETEDMLKSLEKAYEVISGIEESA